MNREDLHRKFKIVDQNFKNLDEHAGAQLRKMMELGKICDRLYLENLTWHMMWDCLMGLLQKKGILTQAEFDAELKALQEATRAAMEAEAKKKAEAEEAATKGKVTVLSETPAIPVLKS